jgi:hypothetical protein
MWRDGFHPSIVTSFAGLEWDHVQLAFPPGVVADGAIKEQRLKLKITYCELLFNPDGLKSGQRLSDSFLRLCRPTDRAVHSHV